MSENNSMIEISQTSISDTQTSIRSKSDPRTADLLPYTREPIGDEPLRHNALLVRYCNQDQCSFHTQVVTNFRRHLKNVHNIIVQAADSDIQVIALEQLKNVYINAGGRTKEDLQNAVFKDALNKAVIQKLLVQIVVFHRLPLSIVEWPIFHSFVSALNPLALHFIPTSHNTVRSSIISIWNEERVILQNQLRTACSKINISLDVWTSPNTLLFLGIVAHFVQHDQACISKALLGLRTIGSHSGEEQFDTLRTVLSEYDCLENLGTIIGDNATTNDTLCRAISSWFEENDKPEWNHTTQRIRCIGHIINLIVYAFLFPSDLKSISEQDLASYDNEDKAGTELKPSDQQTRRDKLRAMGSLGKLHNIVIHIRSSGPRTAEFFKIAGKRIPLDNRTRWNSWYRMLRTAIEVEKDIDFYLKSQKDLKKDILSPTDWTMLRTIEKFLSIFEKITLQNEGDQHNISESLLSLFVLKWHIKSAQSSCQTKTSQEKDFLVRLNSAYEALQKWWNILWNHPTYLIATVLNPKYRTEWFQKTMAIEKSGNIDSKLQEIQQIWLDWYDKQKQQEDFESQSYDKKKEQQRQLLEEVNSTSIEMMNKRILGNWSISYEELDNYMIYVAQPCSLNVPDALIWWNDPVQQDRFPYLAKFAIEILSFPPMSDEAERIFSGTRRTISWERSRLQPDIIEATECYHHFLKAKIP